MAHYTNGKNKCKGAFEWEDPQNHKVSVLHKNKSYLIIPKAVFNYFINNIPPEKYLQENRNIYDYCGGVKSKGDWYFQELKVDENRIFRERRLQKVMRYYISKKGCKIVKRNPDGRQLQIEAGKWMMTEFNTYQEKPWEEYGVNEEYYLKKIYEEIANIVAPPPVFKNTLF